MGESLPFIVILEGIIGVGKTTIGLVLRDLLAEERPVRFFPEYINKPLLNQYIGDMKKYAYGFQLVMMSRRLETYKEALEYCERTGGIAIIGRSILGDTAFALMQHQEGNISSEEWEVYKKVLKLEESRLPPNEKVRYLFLDCPPDEALRRIRKRGFQEEVSGYTLEYLQGLERAYRKNLEDLPNLTTIDWFSPSFSDPLISTCPEVRRRIGEEVLRHLNS